MFQQSITIEMLHISLRPAFTKQGILMKSYNVWLLFNHPFNQVFNKLKLKTLL